MKVATTGKISDYGHVILKVVSGSTSYGTNIDEKLAKELAKIHGGVYTDYLSDMDIRGVFIPYPQYSYCREPLEVFEDPNEEDAVYFSLRKFVQLVFDGTPNALEILFTDEKHILFADEYGRDLINHRDLFLSKTCFSTFGSYAASQLKKMVVKSGEFNRNNKRLAIINTTKDKGTPYDSKNAMHLIRLLQMAIEIFNTGTLKTLRPNREFLLSVRHGEFSLDEIQVITAKLFSELEIAYKNSTLRDYPEFNFINNWLVISTLGFYKKSSYYSLSNSSVNLSLLPPKFSMIESCTSFLVGDSFSSHVNSSDAFGFFLPYHDWFIGLFNDDELKFDNTSLDSVYKFAYGFLSYNPKHLFSVYAPSKFKIKGNEFSDKLISILQKHHSMHYINASLNGFALGNLKKMQKWEVTKKEHTDLSDRKKKALEVPKSHWNNLLSELDEKVYDNPREKEKERSQIMKEFHEWSDLTANRRTMPLYPPVPKNTSNESASLMGRFGYDTLSAAMLYQQLHLLKHILSPNDTFNLNNVLEECHAIMNGKYSTFDLFEEIILSLHSEVSSIQNPNISEKVNLDSVYEEICNLIIDYI